MQVKSIFIFMIIFSTCMFCISGQEMGTAELPAWVLYEKGNTAFDNKNIGRALSFYRQAMNADRFFPEAEAGMARVFQATGEYELAITYYNRALENERSLYILEEKYEILYRLSEIYSLLEQWKDYEDTLLRITAGEAVFSSEENRYKNLREAMFRILKEEGINQLLVLYRIEDLFPYRAHTELGDFYLHTGRNKHAKDHLTFAIVSLISKAMEAVRKFEIDYSFSTLNDFFNTAFFHVHIKNFCIENGLFKNLYYLGTALYGLGDFQNSRKLWQIVADYQESLWSERAEDQLKNPSQAPITIRY